VSALALLGAGCGSGDQSAADATGSPDEAELQGESPGELKEAREVQVYFERNCAPPGAIEKLPEAVRDAPKNAPYVDALEGMEAMCGQMESIAVEGQRVTIRSDVHAGGAKAAAEAFCALMQGSDVADFTPGHELQSLDGTTIKRCPARAD
jgi:hypothetical protein